MGIRGQLGIPSISTKTANYTLAIVDQGSLVCMNKAIPNTVTIPPQTDVAFMENAMVQLIQYGAGVTSVVAGIGVTIRSKGSALTVDGQYAGAVLTRLSENEWWLAGEITV